MMAKKRSILIVLALVLIVAIAAGGTLAWLTSSTSALENTFDAGEVPVVIQENFIEGTGEKTNVNVKNVGNVPAYIRVAIIPTWMEEDGGSYSFVGEPASMSDVALTPGSSNWIQVGEYYYYKLPVDAKTATENLADSIRVNTPNTGYYLNLQIVADSIQAEPAGAVEAMWTDVKVVDGKLEVK